jgi:pimeloyl-ACP methyl ester carboxylesterase
MEPRTTMLHGRVVTYADAGAGPVLLLVHGMGGGYENWRDVVDPLAHRHTVVAPDLPGHGTSAAGNGDYSIGGLAVGLRDLLLALGHERATLVGHSLGRGIVMQLAYQFPELAERLVLVSSGGLGAEVSLILRAAAQRSPAAVLRSLTESVISRNWRRRRGSSRCPNGSSSRPSRDGSTPPSGARGFSQPPMSCRRRARGGEQRIGNPVLDLGY